MELDLLDLLLDDMHLHGASLVEVDLAAEDIQLCLESTACAVYYVIIGGAGQVRVGQEAPRRVGSGDVVLLPAGAAHSIGQGPEQQTFAIAGSGGSMRRIGSGGDAGRMQMICGQARFDAELARPVMAALPTLLHIPSEGGQLPPWITIGVEFIRQELRAELPAKQAVMNRMADILLIECLRRFVAAIPADGQSWLRALLDPALSRALAAIHARPEQAWTVDNMARRANLSRSAFAERFRQCMGQTPMQYLTSHRLRKAAWQLRHTAQPVGRIAEAAGYASASAFTQSFLRHYGCSPRAYRSAPSEEED